MDFTPIYKKKAPSQGSAKKPITSGKSAEKVQKEAIPAQKLKREGKTQTNEENSKEEVQLNYPAGMKQKSITGKNGEKLEQIMQSSGATISIDGDKGFFLFLIEAFFSTISRFLEEVLLKQLKSKSSSEFKLQTSSEIDLEIDIQECAANPDDKNCQKTVRIS